LKHELILRIFAPNIKQAGLSTTTLIHSVNWTN